MDGGTLPRDETASVPTASMQVRFYGLSKATIEDGRERAGEKLREVQVARASGAGRLPARHALRAQIEAARIRMRKAIMAAREKWVDHRLQFP